MTVKNVLKYHDVDLIKTVMKTPKTIVMKCINANHNMRFIKAVTHKYISIRKCIHFYTILGARRN